MEMETIVNSKEESDVVKTTDKSDKLVSEGKIQKEVTKVYFSLRYETVLVEFSDKTFVVAKII